MPFMPFDPPLLLGILNVVIGNIFRGNGIQIERSLPLGAEGMPRSVEDFFRHMRTKLVQSQV
jgi:hypothetical protein